MKRLEQLMDAGGLDRTLTRITHQILERHPDLSSVGIVGMQTRGVNLARRIVEKVNSMEDIALVPGSLDATLYRDDYRNAFRQPKKNWRKTRQPKAICRFPEIRPMRGMCSSCSSA